MMLRNIFRKLLKKEEGSVPVIVAIGFTVLMGCAAIAVDLGSTYYKYVDLQCAVDNAVNSVGDLLPTNNMCAIEDKAEEMLEANGLDVEELDLDYDTKSSNCKYYSVRLTAYAKVDYGFAKVFGKDQGTVAATAKISKGVLGGTSGAVSLYICEGRFNADALNVGEMITISYANNGKLDCVTVDGAELDAECMGLIELATPDDEINLDNYNQFQNDTQRDKYYVEYGYYGMDEFGNKTLLNIGDVRALETATSRFAQSKQGLKNRISNCEDQCGSSCSRYNYKPNCPRIMLIPVVAPTEAEVGTNILGTSEFTSGKDAETIDTANAVVRYFVAVYMDTVTHKGNNITMKGYLLDDYRISSGNVIADDSIEVNDLVISGAFFEE